MPLTNLDIDLVRTFVTIAETKSFTRAAERLLRNQSTISLQIKRLEEALGRQLMERSPRAVRLTPEGETFIEDARRLIAMNDEMVARVVEPHLQGLVRLGTPEDFATSHLPQVLSRFARSHREVALEVTCDLTLNLLDRFREGAFDLVLVKREPTNPETGLRVWREPLVWVAADHDVVRGPETLALVVSPAPCVYRKRATLALEACGRDYRVAYTCGSLAGALAAVRARLGVTVLPKDMVPADVVVIDDADGLPELHDTEIALLTVDPLSPPARRLADHIQRALEHGPVG
ncbi:MAG: LysR substrate-binding domain-containing protein [Alphaproteobacteria bacterium]